MDRVTTRSTLKKITNSITSDQLTDYQISTKTNFKPKNKKKNLSSIDTASLKAVSSSKSNMTLSNTQNIDEQISSSSRKRDQSNLSSLESPTDVHLKKKNGIECK